MTNWKPFWVLLLSDDVTAKDWWTEAEKVDARNPHHAAESFAQDWCDMEDGEEREFLVANNAEGTDAELVAITCEVVREYSATSKGPREIPPRQDPVVDGVSLPPVDTLTLPLPGVD